MLNRIQRKAFLLAFTAALPALADDTSAPFTFSRQIAPILQNNCQICHRPGEAAPMSFLTYADVRPWAKSIKKAVHERTMPPWHADASIGKWKNDPRLSEDEINAVVAWVDQGAPEGNPADLPAPRAWAQGWQMGEPDMIFKLPKEQLVRADTIDEYRYLTIPMRLKEDTWIDALEVRPGNRQVVHHVNVFETSHLFTPETLAAMADATERSKDKSGKARKMSGQGFGPQGEPSGRVGGFLPGGLPLILRDGEAVLLPAGSSLMLQIHYHNETGAEARDLTSVGIRVRKTPVIKRVHGGAVDNCQFKIPAGDANCEVNAELIVQENVSITAMSPHMHLRGKDYRVWAELPNGEKRDILNVPRYDFNWQTTYEPATPIALPAGTKLRTRAHYDNSKGNAFNPNPNIDIEWGEPTTDEMMLMFFRYTREKDPLGL